jgi:hypothetical protein
VKRPWFQLHLATCIVLMFVAGGLIYSNTRFRYVPVSATQPTRYSLQPGETMYSLIRGWPLPLLHYREVSDRLIGNESFEWAGDNSVLYRPKIVPFRMTDSDPNTTEWNFRDPPKWNFWNCAANLAAALALLAGSACLTESLLRRHDARHE